MGNNSSSGGNSPMTLKNNVLNQIETDIKNHVKLMNKTVQNVTQTYTDNVNTDTDSSNTIVQSAKFENINMGGNTKLSAKQKAEINSILQAESIITSTTNDSTNLGAIMQSALKQAVESQSSMDTSQKAINVLEQLDQNNGGIEGVMNKFADTLTSAGGGNNTSQNVFNNLTSIMRQNIDNELNLDNIIETNVKKKFDSNTSIKCKIDSSIVQSLDFKNINMFDNAKLIVSQEAAIDSLTSCFSEVYNTKTISSDMTVSSEQNADNAIKAIDDLKSEQDVTNKLKQTKLQKNFLDSIAGSSGMMCIIIVVIILVIIMGLGSAFKSGSGKGGVIMSIIAIICVIIVIIIIVFLVIHKDVFNKIVKMVENKIEEIYSPNSTFTFEKQSDNTYKIYCSGEGEEDYMLLVSRDSNTHSAKINDGIKINRVPNSRNLEFTSEDVEPQYSTFVIKEVLADGKDKKYMIQSKDGKYIMGLYAHYSKYLRKDDNNIIVEPILYKTETATNILIVYLDAEKDDDDDLEGKLKCLYIKDKNDKKPKSLKKDYKGIFYLSKKSMFNNSISKDNKLRNENVRGVEIKFPKKN